METVSEIDIVNHNGGTMLRNRPVFFVLLFLSIVFLTNCTKDSSNPTGGQGESLLVGNWVPDTVADYLEDFLILTDEDKYYFLSSDELNYHDVSSGFYIISDGFINFGSVNVQYSISEDGNALTLSTTELTITYHRVETAPDPNEWVVPLSYETGASLSYDLGYSPDLTSDGEAIWIWRDDYSDTYALKVNAQGDSLGQFSLRSGVGLDYSNGLLWTVDYGTDFILNNLQLNGFDPATGLITDSLTVTETTLFSTYGCRITRTGDYFWIFDQFDDRLIKVNAATGAAVDEFPMTWVDGITSVNGKLMAIYMYSVVEINPETGLFVTTYGATVEELLQLLQNYPAFNGLAWDGTSFYTLKGTISADNHSIMRLSISE